MRVITPSGCLSRLYTYSYNCFFCSSFQVGLHQMLTGRRNFSTRESNQRPIQGGSEGALMHQGNKLKTCNNTASIPLKSRRLYQQQYAPSCSSVSSQPSSSNHTANITTYPLQTNISDSEIWEKCMSYFSRLFINNKEAGQTKLGGEQWFLANYLNFVKVLLLQSREMLLGLSLSSSERSHSPLLYCIDSFCGKHIRNSSVS